MSELIDKISSRHFIIESDLGDEGYRIEFEGNNQANLDECQRFLKSIDENEKIIERLKHEIQNIQELKSMHEANCCNCDNCKELTHQLNLLQNIITKQSRSNAE